MTTSVLLTQSGELSDYDMQVLRDYAVEAPQPWRNALGQLIAAQERDWTERDFHQKYLDLKKQAREAIDKLQDLVLTAQHHAIDLNDGIDANVTVKQINAAEKLATAVDEALTTLQDEGEKETMDSLLKEIEAEIGAPATKWSLQTLEEGGAGALLYVGQGTQWHLQVAVLGKARLGTAVSKERSTVMKMTDALAELTESRARAVIQS